VAQSLPNSVFPRVWQGLTKAENTEVQNEEENNDGKFIACYGIHGILRSV
jgi:hypothetical protein